MSKLIISRLAPTPSGYLHLGNVFNFILTWLEVRSRNGILHLRIDDIDKQRERRAFVDDIFSTLAWLGLDYDEGPKDTDDFYANYSQTLRQNTYLEALERLTKSGFTYNCQCTRKVIERNAIHGQYARTCRDADLPYTPGESAIRIDTTKASVPKINNEEVLDRIDDMMRDFIVRRSDGVVAYQLASVVDDALTGCNLIVRGQDLWSSTLAQYHLASLLGYQNFLEARFIHHPLVVDHQQVKLSKSHVAPAARTLYPHSADLIAAAGRWLGLGDGFRSLPALLEAYKSNNI